MSCYLLYIVQHSRYNEVTTVKIQSLYCFCSRDGDELLIGYKPETVNYALGHLDNSNCTTPGDTSNLNRLVTLVKQNLYILLICIKSGLSLRRLFLISSSLLQAELSMFSQVQR